MAFPMAILPYVPAGLQTLGTLLQKRQRPVSPLNTMYGRTLRRISREGMWSPMAQRKIFGGVGAQTGNVAQQQTADIRGQLASQGMLDSVAGTRTLAEPGMQRMRTLADVARDIYGQQEMSKIGAERELGQAMYGYESQKRQAGTDYWNQLVSGLASAGQMALQPYMEQKQMQDMFDIIMSYIKNGMFDEAEELLNASERNQYSYAGTPGG